MLIKLRYKPLLLSLKFVLLIFVVLVVSACDKPTTDSRQALLKSDGTIPKSEQRAGSAAKGRKALINEPIVSCGFPLSSLPALDGLAEYTFPEREGAAGKLPYNVNLVTDKNGVELAASNCLACHAAPLFGELVVGLGNEFLDFTTDPSVVVEQSGALVSGQAQIAAWEKFADRVAAISPYMQMETAGVNPANNLTFALMSHRNPENMLWQDEPVTKSPSEQAPPVSVPPWWRMKKKHAMFWMGEGRGDHASIMMTAAIMCSDSIEDVKQLDAIAPDIRAFIDSIEAPPYPFEINASLAQEGKSVFKQMCSQCHGTYGDDPSYPNRLVSIDVVQTDASLIEYAFGDGQIYVDWFNRSPFGQLAQAAPSRGYVAPPLDGIWATAPFLHNGSIPTIQGVLDSKSRPSAWHHQSTNSTSKDNFNTDEIGWNYTVLQSSTNTAQENNTETELSVPAQWVYDTSVPGYSNSGHQFGDALSTEQRQAVIEYLKTL